MVLILTESTYTTLSTEAMGQFVSQINQYSVILKQAKPVLLNNMENKTICGYDFFTDWLVLNLFQRQNVFEYLLSW